MLLLENTVLIIFYLQITFKYFYLFVIFKLIVLKFANMFYTNRDSCKHAYEINIFLT